MTREAFEVGGRALAYMRLPRGRQVRDVYPPGLGRVMLLLEILRRAGAAMCALVDS